MNRRTRSASPLAQLSHLAARLPTPSSIKLKRKQKKQKSAAAAAAAGEEAGDADGGGGAVSSRSSSLQRPASTPIIVGTNAAAPIGFQQQPQQQRPYSADGGAGSSPGVVPASPIFHRGLGSQMNLTLERGTVLARTRDAIVEQSRSKLDNEEHRTLNYYLDE